MKTIHFWKRAVFIRLLLPLIIGIILQKYYPLNIKPLVTSLIVLLTGCFIFEISSLRIKRFFNFSGFAFFIIFILMGQITLYFKNTTHDPQFYDPKINDKVLVQIAEPLQDKPNTYKAEVSLKSVIRANVQSQVISKAIVYFIRSPQSAAIQYGDEICVNKKFETITNLGNPGEFDYKTYLADRQIYYRVLLNDDDWMLTKRNNEFSFTRSLFKIRTEVLNILKQNFNSVNETGIAEALLIGYTADLDKSTQQAYSNIGVIHIIAISGMHLGFIYLMLSVLFNNIPFLKRSKSINSILILATLWSFALLTGANASILRSAIMFSVMILSKLNGRRNNTYNALCISAFLLLCYNPYLLWDLGFQLSYISITSILIFHKKIFSTVEFQNKLLIAIWEMMSLTLSAQILTFPLCIYYFHQFPNTFLLSNLLLIPLSTIALFAEILMVLFYKIIYLGPAIIKVTAFLIVLMNNITIWFNNVPNGTTTNIVSTLTSTLFLYLFILFLWMTLLKRNRVCYYASATCLIAFFTIISIKKYYITKQSKIIVYNLPKSSKVEIIKGKKFKSLATSLLSTSVINYTIKPAHLYFYAENNDNNIAALQDNFFIIGNHIGLLLDNNTFKFTPATNKVKVDWMILTNRSFAHLSDVSKMFQCNMYIIDSSNPLWKIDEWKKECESLHLPFYVTAEQGAYIMDL